MSKTATEKIKFHYIVQPFHFSNRIQLKSFLYGCLKKEGKSINALNYIFCNDEYLLDINRQYLNHDTLTDIITFELSSKSQPLLSDIYISIDMIRMNAGEYGTSFKQELHRVIFHGALHLLGYKDKSEAQSKLMRLKEDEWLHAYFVSRETRKK